MRHGRRTHLSPFGQVLRHWRSARGMSQLQLAVEAEVSARHLSFLETGRARPSRQMIHALSTVLDVPLRERNALLTAAGYTPAYAETPLEAPALGPARRALDLLLSRHEPFPAVVLSRHWDVLERNRGAERLFAFLAPDPALTQSQPPNLLRSMFHPRGLRPFVDNWEQVGEALVQRVHREAIGGVPDGATRRLLAEVLAYPGVPQRWGSPTLGAPLAPLVPVVFRKGALTLSWVSAVTTLGTPQDVTLQELRLESFFPTDEATEASARAHYEDAAAAGRDGGSQR